MLDFFENIKKLPSNVAYFKGDLTFAQYWPLAHFDWVSDDQMAHVLGAIIITRRKPC